MQLQIALPAAYPSVPLTLSVIAGDAFPYDVARCASAVCARVWNYAIAIEYILFFRFLRGEFFIEYD